MRQQLQGAARRLIETAVILAEPLIYDGTEMVLVPRCQYENLRQRLAEYEEHWFGSAAPLSRP